MAPLRGPEDAKRLDFDLLRESPVSHYRSREVLTDRRLLALIQPNDPRLRVEPVGAIEQVMT